MRHRTLQKILWWLCLLAAPLVLVILELFHPANFTKYPGVPGGLAGMYGYLSTPQPYNPDYKALAYFGPQWWFALHMIQTPMVALVAIGLWILADLTAASGTLAVLVLAWLSRIATFVFFIYYTALDSIGGSGLGRTILNTQMLVEQGKLPMDRVGAVAKVLNTTWIDPWVGGVGSFISETGSWAAFIAALFAALALLVDRKTSWIPALLLTAFGWELQMSHTMPHGPIAFALLIVAGIRIWQGNRQPAG